jgi:hypothetical protein
MSIHIAQIALIQIDSVTKLPFTKDVSAMNKYTTQQTPSNTRARDFSTEHRVIVDVANAPNSAGNPDIITYLTAEDAGGYKLVHMDQTYIVTQK